MTEPAPISRSRRRRGGAQAAARPAGTRAPGGNGAGGDVPLDSPPALPPDHDVVARLESAGPGPGELEDDDELLPGEPVRSPDYHPRELGRSWRAPLKVAIILECPTCSESATVEATLSARVVRDSDGSGSLALRTRAAKVAHVCGQLALGLAEGPRVR